MWLKNIFFGKDKKEKQNIGKSPDKEITEIAEQPVKEQFSNFSDFRSLNIKRLKDQRHIRVFISSTFSDMEKEREILIKKIFPKLRLLCEERYVSFTEVDLRWGISKEQKEQGQVLPICLDEIERCRPYFIGILGERYGWIPDEIPQDLIEKEKWLNKHKEHSVTELEILHGVLNNPNMAENAFFYFRNPKYVDKIPENEKKKFIEIPDEEIVKKFGEEKANEFVENKKTKLNILKERIKKSGYPLFENYDNPEALGQKVFDDFEKMIEREYPVINVPDLYEKERMEHKHYADSRFNCYIIQNEYFDRLDNYIHSGWKPIIITGSSGMGKSALIANWVKNFQEKNDGFEIYSHYVGATSTSSDLVSMLRRIITTFKKKFDINVEIPQQGEQIISDFPNWLHLIAAKGKIIITIDALNQLDSNWNAKEYNWLPEKMPGNIRIIVSVAEDKTHNKLREKDWNILEINPLERVDKIKIIKEYLNQYRKELESDLIEKIVSSGNTDNPLFLRTLLEEVRIFGDHFKLSGKIEYYLKATSCKELFKLIIKRYISDYDENKNGLIKEILTAVFCSQNGLLENEIIEFLEKKYKSVSNLWFTFYSAANKQFIERSGLITFGHNYFREAVEEEFGIYGEVKKKSHSELAELFKSKEDSFRKLSELPYQLVNAEKWIELKNVLLEDKFLVNLWEKDYYKVMKYWELIEEKTNFNMLNEYSEIIYDYSINYSDQYIGVLASLYTEKGYLDEALEIYERLIKIFEEMNDSWNLQNMFGSTAKIYLARGYYQIASDYYQKQKEICEKNSYKKDLARGLNDYSIALKGLGKIYEAIEMVKKSEYICRELGDYEGICNAQCNLGVYNFLIQNYQESMDLLNKGEEIAKMIGNIKSEAYIYGSQALILKVWKQYHQALVLQQKDEELCRMIGDWKGVQTAIGNQANIYYQLKDYQNALKLHKIKEKICRDKDFQKSLTYCLSTQGIIYSEIGEVSKGLGYLEEEELICRKLGLVLELARCLINQAGMLNDPVRARKLADEGLAIAKNTGLISFYNQLNVIVGNILD